MLLASGHFANGGAEAFGEEVQTLLDNRLGRAGAGGDEHTLDTGKPLGLQFGRAIDNFEAFMKFLAPLSRGAITDEARAGEQIFGAIGCASCHVPALSTGAHASAALHRRNVPLFSDLLLHDIGTGDGIAQEAAEPEEIRTPALWGLRFRRPLMHDGGAMTPAEAIRQHAGEASEVMTRYRSLTDAQRRALLLFLDSL